MSCLGRGLDAHAAALEAGVTGLGALSLFAAPELSWSPVGEVPAAALEGTSPEAFRIQRLGVVAARDALGGVQPPGGGVVVVGTTTGSVLESEVEWQKARDCGGDALRSFRDHPMGETAFALASELGLDAECHTFATACSSSSNAIGYGALRIRHGAPWALVGGVDTLCRVTYAGFYALKLLSRGASKPFDVARSGVSIGEAAAFLRLEPLGAAMRRGAPILAVVAGWGCAVDAFHQTAPDPSGEGMMTAMASALADARLPPDEVAYVNAHGTATEANDRVESFAMRRLFGDRQPYISSTKGLTGHSLGAAGALEAVVSIAALRDGRAPATTGLEQLDPKCDVRQVPPGGVDLPGDSVLSNSFGFGGNNASLVLQRPSRARSLVTPLPPPRAFIHGLGVVAPGALGCDALLTRLGAPPRPDVVPEPVETGAKRRSRLTRLERMAVGAAREALGPHSVKGTALVVGTCYGRLAAAADFLEGTVQRGLEHGSPFAFYESVYHALAGHLGIELGLKGVGITTSARELTAESALRVAIDLLGAHGVERVLVVAADDATPALAGVLDASHPLRKGWAGLGAPAGAAALLLSRESAPLVISDCTLVRHPCFADALPTPSQTRALLDAKLGHRGRETLASSFFGEELGVQLQAVDDWQRFGLNPSGGLLRLVAAAVRLERHATATRAAVHGLALGGGQGLSVVEKTG
ncbi:MAG: beta-ketoacyl-[acyl-carrier-protein] synthase family protein [Myxococcaceae bacterium]|nr:beta-ketoacyl-[acyl-carrier-protein] synthase family protein [Myxococcaceae bacterium]